MAKTTTTKAMKPIPVELAGKWKALESALDQIKDKFGDGSIMKLSENSSLNIETIPTGSISLDLALGVGGIPKGRIIEVYGPESSGKTTLTLHMIAAAQGKGGLAAFIDAEHALDPEYAKRIGVNLDDLLISQPDNGEQALDIAETLVRSNSLDIIVIDSVAALTPRAEIEGEMGDSHMGLQARLMSQALRKLTGIISKSNTTLIFINQIRMKIGVMFGNPETTTGGNALKFYSSVRLEVRRTAQIKNGEKIVGNRVKVKVVKNKVAPPFKIAEFDIMYNEGISAAGDLLDTGVTLGAIAKNGNTYMFEDVKLGVGRENSKTFIRENKDIMKKMDAAIRKKIASGEVMIPPGGASPEDEE
jgi:recombination protein RecA